MKKVYDYVEPRLPLFIGIIYSLLMLSFFIPWIMFVAAGMSLYLLVLIFVGAKNGW